MLLLSNGVCVRAENIIKALLLSDAQNLFYRWDRGNLQSRLPAPCDGGWVGILGKFGSYKDHRFLWSL